MMRVMLYEAAQRILYSKKWHPPICGVAAASLAFATISQILFSLTPPELSFVSDIWAVACAQPTSKKWRQSNIRDIELR